MFQQWKGFFVLYRYFFVRKTSFINMKKYLLSILLYYNITALAQVSPKVEKSYYNKNIFLIDAVELLTDDEYWNLKKLLENHHQETGNTIWIRIKTTSKTAEDMETEAENMFLKLSDNNLNTHQTLILILSENDYIIKHNWEQLAQDVVAEDDYLRNSIEYEYAKEKGVSDLVVYRLKVNILLHYIYHTNEAYKGLQETVRFIRAVHNQEITSRDIDITPNTFFADTTYGIIIFWVVLMIMTIVVGIFLIIRNIIKFAQRKHSI